MAGGRIALGWTFDAVNADVLHDQEQLIHCCIGDVNKSTPPPPILGLVSDMRSLDLSRQNYDGRTLVNISASCNLVGKYIN